MGKKKTIEQTYQKKTPLEHVLDRPGTYIGSVQSAEMEVWLMSEEGMQKRTIEVVPGLYKIFDEILVNAFDQYVRLRQEGSANPVTQIKVIIDPEAGRISVQNDGEGIPVVEHAEHGKYIPEMIFGEFLTSGNYDDDEERITGGMNGYGAKLVNAFSRLFLVETVDQERDLKFTQKFVDNMKRKAPKVAPANGAKSFTRITFEPDLPRFGMQALDEATVALLEKRVYDVAGCCAPNVKVYLNKKLLKVPSFEKYVELYLGQRPIYYSPNERWEVAVGVSADEKMEQISFVNGMATLRGGKHVDHVAGKVTKAIQSALDKKRGKQYSGIKASHIKDNMWIFVKATIVKPEFDSQTKETLTTKVSQFGSSFDITGKDGEKFIKSIIDKSGIVERALALSAHKEQNQLTKSDGKMRKNLRGIPKLDDANWAGGAKSAECTLILTEGDSAKTFATSGISELGRDKYGIFPLRGKLLNTRKDEKKVADNAEVGYLKQILGLQQGKKYQTVDGLRYGRILILTDQDVDGFHIQGLVMNFIHTFWPSLLEIPGFICNLATPLVRATRRGEQEMIFYNENDYKQWRAELGEAVASKWNCKYFKGLGTSTGKEAKEIMMELENRLQLYVPDERLVDSINLAFANGQEDARKEWLKVYDPNETLDVSEREVPFSEFIHRGLKLFSIEDNVRSIPHLMDGLKPSQRKIVFASLKKNVTGEIKVAQLAGAIAEMTAYHHGEKSLEEAIVGLAADYVGSNNMNYLEPRGQFGTRLMGGKDHASSRYIFTCLNPITRLVFRPEDDLLLNYLSDDGQQIEPLFYLPVLPTILINGADGIGTGYSTGLPSYNPLEVSSALRGLVSQAEGGGQSSDLRPWFRGFTGEVELVGRKGGATYGRYERVSDTSIRITELPVQTWTDKYWAFIEGLVLDPKADAKTRRKQVLAGCDKYYNEKNVDIVIHFNTKRECDKVVRDSSEFIKQFRLKGSFSLSNIHLFNEAGEITKYGGPEEIIRDFYQARLPYYEERRAYLLVKLKREFDMNRAKVRFIEEVNAGQIVLYGRDDAEEQLESAEYPKFATRLVWPVPEDEAVGYAYLLDMPMRSLTNRRLNELRTQADMREAEYNTLLHKTANQLWLEDLDEFDEGYRAELARWEAEQLVPSSSTDMSAKVKGGRKSAGSGRKRKTKAKVI